MTRSPYRALAVAACIGWPPAAAQDAAQSKPVKLTLDAGFVNVSGNNDVTTLNLGERLAYTTGRWTVSQTATAIYGETGGRTTAEAYTAGLRADYAVGAWLSAFVLGTYDRNPFAGVARRWSEGAGLGARVIRGARDSLVVEGSLSLNQERDLARVLDSFAGSRAALAYKHVFGPAASLTQHVELLSNLEVSRDQRVNSETAITAQLSQRIALKTAYLVRFDNLPEPGFEDTDRVLTTGVQVVF